MQTRFESSRQHFSNAELPTPTSTLYLATLRQIAASDLGVHARLNGTQRLFMKRLNRLTVCFSKKLRNLQAAFSMFVAYYNFCWQTRKPGKSGQKCGTAAMMAGLAGHVWSFDELFDVVMG